MADDTARPCRYCGEPILSPNGGRGRWKRYCDEDCRTAGRMTVQSARKARRPFCTVPGCSRPARSIVAGYCEAHYYRLRRNGTLGLKDRADYRVNPPAEPTPVVDGRGYVRVHHIDHPLAGPDRSVFEHRMVAYDERGGGDPACEWCGLPMNWDTAVIDHADDNKTNNTPSNLVVSCHQCNTARGQCSPRRFAEGVAVRVLCRIYADQRKEIVEQVMNAWADVGGKASPDVRFKRFGVSLFATEASPKGARGKTA